MSDGQAPPGDPDVFDALVVGAGPAGLAAATWLGRYRRATIVVDSGQPRSRWTETTHGYLSRGRISPRALLELGRADAAAYPTVRWLDGRAAAARTRPGGGFTVDVDGAEIRTRRLVLATGVQDAFPDVEGFFEHYGADVFHCPSCDGYEARDRTVVAFGWTPHLVAFAAGLLDWARSVTVVAPAELLADQSIDRDACTQLGLEVVEGQAAALEGSRGALEAVRLADGLRLPTDLAFFSIAHRPNVDLAGQLGCALDAEGYVTVDQRGETSVAGVFAAGDCTPGTQLVQLAAAEGARAGVECALSLQGEPPGPGTPARAPDVAGYVEPEER